MKKAVLITFLATASAFALPIAALSAAAAPEAKAASCARGTKPAVIAGNFKCLRAGLKCSASYQAQYRKYGFHCAKGRLLRGTGLAAKTGPMPSPFPPSTPPPPTPAAVAVDGHYKGVTSQSETFEFDITNGGLTFRGLKTGQINEGCTPAFHLYAGYLDWPDYTVPISRAGDFSIDTALTGWTVGASPVTSKHVTIRGHITGQAGSGSLETKTAFTYSNGVSYACGSGLQTWTVTRTG